MDKRAFRRHVQALATGALVVAATGCEEAFVTPAPAPNQSIPAWVTLKPKEPVRPLPNADDPPKPPVVKRKVVRGYGSNPSGKE